MKTSTRIYAWLKLLAILHVLEQMIFGMEDLNMFRRTVAGIHRCGGNTDTATVSLAIATFMLICVGMFLVLKGGTARFLVLIILGIPNIAEIHHLFETAHARHYTPGTVTAIPTVICGFLFLHALVKEYRAPSVIGSTDGNGSYLSRSLDKRLCALS